MRGDLERGAPRRSASSSASSSQSGRKVHLHVSDDGRGFDLAAVSAAGREGFGLTSMRERAHAFGGAFDVHSRPGSGTQVEVGAVSDPVRVLLADDHVPTRHDIRRALEADSRFVVCAEAGDAPAAIEAAVRETPDICVLDVRMPGSGVAAAWEISSRLPQTKIVMLTVSSDDTDLFASLRAGASGYLLKDMDPATASGRARRRPERRGRAPAGAHGAGDRGVPGPEPETAGRAREGRLRDAHEPRMAGPRPPAPGAHRRRRSRAGSSSPR